mmetsp:Transcript_6304/g.11482  ORF Transcript_6304/g.11482 Transcript_6304/m.11482 type:complete len:225 (+) Transcript_6304:790-1464(+)
MAALIRSSASRSLFTGSGLASCDIASISCGDNSASSSSRSSRTGFSSSFETASDTSSISLAFALPEAVAFSSSNVVILVPSPISPSNVVDSEVILSEDSSCKASCFSFSFSFSCSFFFAAASLSSCSCRIRSFCCSKTASLIFITSGLLFFSSDVATSNTTSFTTSLSRPEMASASPAILFLPSSSARIIVISSLRKKIRLIINNEIGTFLLTLKSNHCWSDRL